MTILTSKIFSKANLYFISILSPTYVSPFPRFSKIAVIVCSKIHILNIYITISTFTSVCPYGVRRRRPSLASRPTSDFYHVQSSRSPVRPLLSEAKPSCVYSILKPHGQSSKREVRPLLSEAKLSCVYSILKPHGQSSRCQVRLLPPRRSRGAVSYTHLTLPTTPYV